MFRSLMVNLALLGILVCPLVCAGQPRPDHLRAASKHCCGAPTACRSSSDLDAQQKPAEPTAPDRDRCGRCFCELGAIDVRVQETVFQLSGSMGFPGLLVAYLPSAVEGAVERDPGTLALSANTPTGIGLRHRLCSLLL